MNEPPQLWKAAVTGAAFVLCLGWESFAPLHRPRLPRFRHYLTNSLLGVGNAVAVQLLLGAAVLATAHYAQARGLGAFHWLGIPPLWNAAASWVGLDLATWALHRLYHVSGLLWCLHRVHHSERDLDVSTASRFHTLEVLLSTAARCLLVLALGANPIGVAVFEVSFIAANHWQHSNVGLPAHVDSLLRWFAVTPNMHRTHHSILRHELDSNFGTIFSCWDRLLGTYNREGSTAAVRIGLPGQQGEGDLTVWDLLAMPFTKLRSP